MIITSTHYNRPECTKQMLEHLLKCRGIEKYTLLCGVEPEFPEVIEEIEKYPLKKIINVNQRLLGCWSNKKSILTKGFLLSDYLIHIEDDIILAEDALEYFEWCKNQKDIASVTAFSLEKRFLNNPSLDRIGFSKLYSPIAWATWKSEFVKLENWNGSDRHLQNLWIDRLHLTPEVSRAKHIGVGIGIRSSQELFTKVKELGHYTKTDNILAQNNIGEEWSKLDDNNIKSKTLNVYNKYNIEFWSDDIKQPKHNFALDNRPEFC